MLSSQAKRELKINQRRILIDSIEIGIPSSQQILTWAERQLPNGKKVGEIKNSKTVNYKKFTPLLDGLFCERIFGPVKSGICACGKKQPHKNMRFCEKCEVEYTDQNVRRYRLGYISLLSSVAHIWYLKGRPSYLSIFLGKRKKTVMALAYCNAYLIEQGFSSLKESSESECRQDHGLEVYSKNIKSFTRTRHFAANFYKSSKSHSNNEEVNVKLSSPDKDFLASTSIIPTLSKRAQLWPTPIGESLEVDNDLSNTLNQLSQKNKKEKAEIVNSFFYLLTHILRDTQENSTTSISYAHYLSSVKDSNKNIVKRKLATILRKEEEKDNEQNFKKSLRLLSNTLINFRKPTRKIDPDNFSKNKHVTLFSTEKLLQNNDQPKNIKLKQISIPKLPRSIGKKNTTINPKFFVKSFSSNLSIRPGELGFDSNLSTQLAQAGVGSVGKVESGQSSDFMFRKKSGRVSFPENNLLCLPAETPQKGTNFYNRGQTLPFLPSLVCKYNLRDELLNIFNSYPLNEDIPIPLYCETKRWQPLQDVHKFMAEQSFFQFNNLKNEVSPQANSFLEGKLLAQSSSSKSPLSSQLLGVEQEKLTINSLRRFKGLISTDRPFPNMLSENGFNMSPEVSLNGIFSEDKKFVSGQSSTFRYTGQPYQFLNPNDRAGKKTAEGGRESEEKSRYKEDDIISLRHILYKTFLKQNQLRHYNQADGKTRQWGINQFTDSQLLLNISTCPNQAPVHSAAILWSTFFDTDLPYGKSNYLDQSAQTLQFYWKSHLLNNKHQSYWKDHFILLNNIRRSVFPYINDEIEVFKQSVKKANIKIEPSFLKEAFEVKGLASHLKSYLQEKINKLNTYSNLLSQNGRYNPTKLNGLKQYLIPNNMWKFFFTNLNYFSFKKASIFSKSIYNDYQDILINRTAKDQVHIFEERLINTVYNLLKEDNETPIHSTVLSFSTEKNACISSFLILPETMRVVNYFNLMKKHSVDQPKRSQFKGQVPLEKDASLVENLNNRESSDSNLSFFEFLEKKKVDLFEKEDKYKKRLQEGQIRHTTSFQVQLPNGKSQFLTINQSIGNASIQSPIGVVNGTPVGSGGGVDNDQPLSANATSYDGRDFVWDKSIPKRVRSTTDQWGTKREPGRGKERELLSQVELTAIREILSYTGGGALKHLLKRFNVQSFSTFLLTDIQITREAYTYRQKAPFPEDLDIKKKVLTGLSRRIYRNARRLKIAQLLTRSNRRPEWMMISTLPVLPPDLRPILQMSENLVVASDLNSLYQRVIYRNNRYYKLRLIDFHLVTAMQRLVQDAVDRLIENGKGGSKPFYTPSGRPLKSLSDTLKGKKGRFRLNLLGKRVDFSGRSVIVVSPHLKIHECGLPKEIALKLYTYFLLRQFMLKKQASSIVIAKKIIKQRKSSMWDMLREIIYYHPLLLNRAPTLHRLGIQAFQPRLVSGSAILLHPLVCSGFNADFDGDQMGVHLPLGFAARAEAWDLLWSRNNILSPATGQSVLVPSQDMVLGFYYMTQSFSTRSLRTQDESLLGKLDSSIQSQTLPSGSLEKGLVRFLDGQYSRVPDIRKLELSKRIFSHYLDVTRAFQNGHITIHTPIWLKWDGKVENDSGSEVPLELRLNSFGNSTQIYSKYKRRNDEQLCYLQPNKQNLPSTIYTRTTVGRVLVNEILFSCRQMGEKHL